MKEKKLEFHINNALQKQHFQFIFIQHFSSSRSLLTALVIFFFLFIFPLPPCLMSYACRLDKAIQVHFFFVYTTSMECASFLSFKIKIGEIDGDERDVEKTNWNEKLWVRTSFQCLCLCLHSHFVLSEWLKNLAYKRRYAVLISLWIIQAIIFVDYC